MEIGRSCLVTEGYMVTVSFFSHDLQVLRGLLERNVSRRLGAKKTTMFDIGGATAVKHHPFFGQIDWAKVVALQVEPPLKPGLLSNTDTSNFCSEFVQMAVPKSLSEDSADSSRVRDVEGSDETPRMFRGFSYVADTFYDAPDCQLEAIGDSGSATGEASAVKDPPGGDTGDVASTRVKKVKGKRVRNKKGRRTAANETQPRTTDTSLDVQPRDAPSPVDDESSSGLRAGSQGPINSSELTQQKTADRPETPPEAEGQYKPKGLAAMLAQQKEKRAPIDSSPTDTSGRVNVWGVRELPTPAPVPIPVDDTRTKIRGAREDTVGGRASTTAGATHGNVWRVSELPVRGPTSTTATVRPESVWDTRRLPARGPISTTATAHPESVWGARGQARGPSPTTTGATPGNAWGISEPPPARGPVSTTATAHPRNVWSERGAAALASVPAATPTGPRRVDVLSSRGRSGVALVTASAGAPHTRTPQSAPGGTTTSRRRQTPPDRWPTLGRGSGSAAFERKRPI